MTHTENMIAKGATGEADNHCSSRRYFSDSRDLSGPVPSGVPTA